MLDLIYPPGINRTQNQDQCFPSVAEMIPLSLPSSSSSTESTEIDSFLRRHYGLNKLKIDWLNRCISELNISTPGFGNLSVADRGDHIYQKFLDSDIKSSSDGVLPDNISTLCENDLPGPFILQVDNIVTRSPHPQRSVMLTDGVRHVVGWEIRPIQAIEDLSPRMKVLISNVTVECGILMLVPEGVDVLRKAKHNTSAVKEEEEANQPRSVKSGDKSHGSTEDEEISLKDFDSLFSDWCNRNKAPTRYKIEIVGKKIGYSAQQVYEAFHSESNLYGKILDALKHKLCSFQGTMLVEMRDSFLPVALEINDEETSSDVTPVLGPLHKVPGSQQKTETFNGAPKRPSHNAVPDSEVNSHGSNKDEVVLLENLDSLCSDWFYRNKTPTKYKFKCVVNAIGELKFDNRTTLQCLLDVEDASCWASVYIPQKMVEEKIGFSAQDVYDAFHSGSDLYDEILDLLEQKLCGFQCTMLVAMTDSYFPTALEIHDEGGQQETEISGGESNVESRVAAGLDKIGVVGCTEAMSEMDIREEKFAGCSNAVPDSGSLDPNTSADCGVV